MDSPSLDSPRPPSLSDPEIEAGEARQTARGTGRATREGVVLVAGFGDARGGRFRRPCQPRIRGAMPSSPPGTENWTERGDRSIA